MDKTRARVLMPNRKQMELRASDLESLLAEGHRARLVWAYVERQDLTGFYGGIRAVDGGVGASRNCAGDTAGAVAVRDGGRGRQRA